MIETEGLTKRFGDLLAVDHLTIRVGKEEVFGFLGPNGAGKTTTVRMLACLIEKSEGRAVVAGHEVGRKGEVQEIRKAIGVSPENAGLYEDLSAYKNLDYYGKLHECSGGQRRERIERLLRMLGLWDKRDERAGTFSRGMKQKLSIARSLVHDPQVLFLDEPTANLDPESSRTVREFIRELKREGKTVFINTHNLDEVEKSCDRVGILKTRLLATGATRELLSSFRDRRTVVELAHAQDGLAVAVRKLGYQEVTVDGNRLVVTVANPSEDNPTIVEGVVRAGGRVLFVTELLPSLEEVYLKLVGELR